MNDAFEQFFSKVHPFGSLGGFILFIGAALCTIVQVSPIKLDPWDFLLGWIGERFNSSINKKLNLVDKRIDAMEKTLSDHIEACDDIDLKKKRSYIIGFVNDGVNGKRHTQESFENAIRICDEYESYVEKNNIKNGVIKSSISAIRAKYNEHLVLADFPEQEIYIRRKGGNTDEQRSKNTSF